MPDIERQFDPKYTCTPLLKKSKLSPILAMFHYQKLFIGGNITVYIIIYGTRGTKIESFVSEKSILIYLIL